MVRTPAQAQLGKGNKMKTVYVMTYHYIDVQNRKQAENICFRVEKKRL